jgi:DNA-binding IscR family transcriptional regulator
MYLLNQTPYAARVILALSKKELGKRFLTSEIGREMLIITQAGRDGGITLACDPHEITLLQVVEYFEGELYLSDCILKPGECPFERKCPVHYQSVRLKNLLRDEMSRITFQQLVEEGSLIEANLTTSASRHPTFDPVKDNVPITA